MSTTVEINTRLERMFAAEHDLPETVLSMAAELTRQREVEMIMSAEAVLG